LKLVKAVEGGELSAEQAFDQRLTAHIEVQGDVAEDAGQRADPEG
jgi:hypothetical protein